MSEKEINNIIIDLGTTGYIPELVKHEAIKTIEMLEEENKILKGTISKTLEFINNHTYRWRDTQFGEMVEVEEFEHGLKPIELINILKNKFENK